MACNNGYCSSLRTTAALALTRPALQPRGPGTRLNAAPGTLSLALKHSGAAMRYKKSRHRPLKNELMSALGQQAL